MSKYEYSLLFNSKCACSLKSSLDGPKHIQKQIVGIGTVVMEKFLNIANLNNISKGHLITSKISTGSNFMYLLFFSLPQLIFYNMTLNTTSYLHSITHSFM